MTAHPLRLVGMAATLTFVVLILFTCLRAGPAADANGGAAQVEARR